MRRRTKNKIGFLVLLAFALGALGGASAEFPRRAAALIAAAIVALLLLRRLFRPRPIRTAGVPEGFADRPWLFDGAEIELQGRVERIFTDTAAEGMRRKIVHAIRNLTGSNNAVGRFSHQRFLMSSPALRSGHAVMVEHNLRYGKLPLAAGAEVELRGEYLHKTFRGRYFYGRIHKTHAPYGYLRKV